MAVQIQLRGGTLAEWTSGNPIIAHREMVLETDTNKFKIGNGADHYLDLPYGGLIGPEGEGLAAGGTAGQILSKVDGTDYNTTWIDNYTGQVKHLVKNDTGVTIPKGSVVYVSSADGTNMNVSLSDADMEATSSKTMGITEAAITQGSTGYVITEGLLSGLNTASATAGQSVWLSTTAGGFVFGAPPAKPAHSVYLGVVTRVQSNNGEIFVKVQNGYEVNELHDVNVTGASNNDFIKLNSSGMWVNSNTIDGGTA
jgi:hypothetical protein